MQEAVIFLR